MCSPNGVQASNILRAAAEIGHLLEVVNQHKEKKDYVKLWTDTADLLSVIEAYRPSDIAINGFRQQAVNWGNLFVLCFSAEEATTYIHIVGEHLHEFLTEHRSIGKFGNWAAEGLHSEIKYTVHHHSPRSGGRGRDAPAYYALRESLLQRKLLPDM